jgi:hypothetical protein
MIERAEREDSVQTTRKTYTSVKKVTVASGTGEKRSQARGQTTARRGDTMSEYPWAGASTASPKSSASALGCRAPVSDSIFLQTRCLAGSSIQPHFSSHGLRFREVIENSLGRSTELHFPESPARSHPLLPRNVFINRNTTFPAKTPAQRFPLDNRWSDGRIYQH